MRPAKSAVPPHGSRPEPRHRSATPRNGPTGLSALRIKADLKRVVEYGLKDTLQGRVVDGTGENRPWISEDKTAFRSQEELYKYYLNENRIKD